MRGYGNLMGKKNYVYVYYKTLTFFGKLESWKIGKFPLVLQKKKPGKLSGELMRKRKLGKSFQKILELSTISRLIFFLLRYMEFMDEFPNDPVRIGIDIEPDASICPRIGYELPS